MTPPLQSPPAIVRTACLSCHGPERTSGGVHLDKPLTAALAKKVLAAIAYDSAVKMPPSGKLLPTEIASLSKWASAASPEKPHWAWQPLRPMTGTIDSFLEARLKAKGLTFSPEADKRTLLRRLSFDLTGLPPTPTELAAFIADKHPNAYETLVDRLLASPAYGERWGRKWLDLVHYGDTHGYDKDKRRDNAWPYRDWVIGALNQDLPYTQFVQQQVAGDVLTPGDPAGIVATGFLVAGPWDFVGQAELREGTVDKEKTRVLFSFR